MGQPKRYAVGDRIINIYGTKGTIKCISVKNKHLYVYGTYDTAGDFGFYDMPRYEVFVGIRHLNALERLAEEC